MDGILNINKTTGMTSHDVVARIRRLLHEKRVGHAGTLDPLASGVLPICVGQATRVAEYLSESGKAYLATIVFGSVTDTYDAEGVIIRTGSTDDLAPAKVEEALQHFVGPQMQVPPRYSAIKLQGQPAYKRARAGEEIELAPRPIVIHKIEIAERGRDQSGPYDSLQEKPPSVTLAVECSKGTYIRSLAYDLGEYLGCGAYLAALIRTRSGPFLLSECITLNQLADALPGEIVPLLYPADKALEDYPIVTLDSATVERVQHGNAFVYPLDGQADMEKLSERTQADNRPLTARVYSEDGRFVAIAERDAAQGVWKPRKVFV